ncbi:MAG: bifunctional folylpolyglutamate synthase/dihydrofolate synthase [Alistipes sp.]|nr:bifunctional folylpolyglutamate synthase/dihydrofolate synthase [Alistipes sp.]
MNYQEAVDYLFGLRRFGKETGARRAARALDMLFHPERTLNIIHVAGTNGKGSVCAYISNILMEQGYTVGMFTSPHLVRVNERIRLNGENISDGDFLRLFEKIYGVSEELKKQGYDGLAFFDFVFVMAVCYYAEKRTDYVVLEAGLGGRTDATAAVCAKQVCVITSISFDHTEILGETIEEIAAEKAGIITDGCPVFYWRSDEVSARIIEDTAGKCNSMTYPVDEKSFEIHKMERKQIDFSLKNRYYKNSMFSIFNTAIYQAANVSLALEVIAFLGQGKNWDRARIVSAVGKTRWEGRMEEVEHNVYIDGAHNPDGMRQFLKTARYMKEGCKMYLLFGAVREKDYSRMIEEICAMGGFDGFVLTRVPNHRALEPEIMRAEFEKNTDKPVYVVEDVGKAYETAKKFLGEKDLLLCAGSLYLVGALKERIGE